MSERESARIEIVCFDLGGVLVRICQDWMEACEAAGVPVRAVPADFASKREALADAHQVGAIEDATYYADVAGASRDAYSPEEVERVHHAWTRTEYEGVRDLIEALRGRDEVRLACLSNTNAAHWRRLAPERVSAPLEYPSLVALQIKLASHLLGLAKPDDAIYRVACDRFAVDPARILFFDDRPENVAAARSAGWRARRVDPTSDPVRDMRAELVRLELL